MKPAFRSIFVLGLLLGSLAQAAQRVESFSWAVGDMPLINLATFHGSIDVEQGESGRVELILEANSSTANDQRWLDAIVVQGSPFGAGLAIGVRQNGLGVEFGVGKVPDRSVKLTLRVPQTCSMDVISQTGTVYVGNDFHGRVRARTMDGDIFIGRIEGEVSAETRRGNLSVARTTGDLSARSHTGDLNIGTVQGRADLRADNGNIDVMSTVGGITAEAIRGDIVAGLEGKIAHEVRLKASAGDVKITVDPATAMQVQARAKWGQVKSDLAVAPTGRGGNGKNRLEGAVNGGGPLVALVASGGNVLIKGLAALDHWAF
ncbi:DUF4097 family beta strand repeat-containing protein [Synoicihabitans lomoniglobus]|uniref:DUF4097 family beta strand repeat-containing protein n=1 Tax=Synoicihabitans lomoniglobus TaxID=2909285 RepID=A0AAF0CR16_9BACT|nr:DUF4097 domain-containing protein [Opitutaceae bacterium LMO-M01]WED66396.1 DUF4097 family beta strand repeat-containing protein [Opitutaceae bacterium LMO-M01]